MRGWLVFISLLVLLVGFLQFVGMIEFALHVGVGVVVVFGLFGSLAFPCPLGCRLLLGFLFFFELLRVCCPNEKEVILFESRQGISIFLRI